MGDISQNNSGLRKIDPPYRYMPSVVMYKRHAVPPTSVKGIVIYLIYLTE